MSEILLEVQGLGRRHRRRRHWLMPAQADDVGRVEDVSFVLERGETLGLVGESGCGKTTLGRLILRLLEPDAGRVLFNGTDITSLSPGRLRSLRPRMQMIFQDLDAALNPAMSVQATLREAVGLYEQNLRAGQQDRRVGELLELVQLKAGKLHSYPRELSGGEKRRVGIARVLALRPHLIIADELTSGLDVSIQAQMINLLTDLQRQLGLSCLFISHDLQLVRLISHRLMVMCQGRIVEQGPAADIAAAPAHPCTQLLWSAGSGEGGARSPAPGGISAAEQANPRACPFLQHCPRYQQRGQPEQCRTGGVPETRSDDQSRVVACHFPAP